MSAKTPLFVFRPAGPHWETGRVPSLGATRTRGSSLRRVAVFVATLLCVCFTGHGEPRAPIAPDPGAALTIRVFDYAGLKTGDLDMATQEAAAILLRAGVPTAWLPCRTNHPSSNAPVCAPTADPTALAMRILAIAVPVEGFEGHAIFGFAFPPGRNGFANAASIFWSRVEDLAAMTKVRPARLLAAILAHEIGHLLLGENSHYPVGLMKAVWDEPEVRQISQNSLAFWAGQHRTLRDAVEKRAVAAGLHRPPANLAAVFPSR
jgi:hypothetical protein